MGRKLARAPSDELLRVFAAYGVERLDQLAERMALPYGTVRNWHARDQIPLAHLLQVEREKGLAVEWLRTGQGERYAVGAQGAGVLVARDGDGPAGLRDRAVQAPLNPVITGPMDGASMVVPLTGETLPLVLRLSSAQGRHLEYRLIPRIQGAASAGTATQGAAVGVDHMVDLGGEMAFSADWLERHIGPDRGQLVSIKVTGDSMSPTILDGESVIIDTANTRVAVSGVYVIAPHGRYQVKRIHLRLDGSLKVMSDNPAYEPEVLASDQAPGLKVVGLVVWPRLR